MLNLKQLFFVIIGLNCLFLVAFFVSVRTPESFTANSNAFTTTTSSSFRQQPDESVKDSNDDSQGSLKPITDDNTAPAKSDKTKDEKADDAPSKAQDSSDAKITSRKPKATKKAAKKAKDSKDDSEEFSDVEKAGRNALKAIYEVVDSAQERVKAADLQIGKLLRRRNNVQSVLRWNNPFFLLGAYPKVLKKYFNSYPDGRPYYEKFNYGVINDPDYCELVDSYNLAHPENMFKEMNFFTDYAKNGLVRRDVIRKIGTDTMRQVSRYMDKKNFRSAQYHLDPTITNYFTKRVDIHIYHMIGKHFNCATQMYNHIPGHGVLKRKDLIVDSVDNYAQVYQDQGLEKCFNKHTFFPFSYRLYIKGECEKFFEKINSNAYKKSLIKEPIQYLVKLGYGAHRANGVFLLDKNYTVYMNELYDNGDKCGKSTDSVIAQTYITNPLLLDKDNKFDFRVYMLVASTNPLIVYYHDGFLRVSLETYNKNSDDRNVHLTNTHLSKTTFEEVGKVNETLANELREYQMWTFERLADYLLESGKIDNPNWLDDYLRPAFKQAFIHTVRMSGYAFWNASNVYEMFGLDFMLDDKLNMWFIECNSSPQLIGTNDYKTNFLIKMLTDLFEIQYGYYRSRMKRVLKVINQMNAEALETGQSDHKAWKGQFKEAMRNRFEDEYRPSKNSSFELIMDLNLKGSKAYFGNIPDECANDSY